LDFPFNATSIEGVIEIRLPDGEEDANSYMIIVYIILAIVLVLIFSVILVKIFKRNAAQSNA
jgi:hypothetical protein